MLRRVLHFVKTSIASRNDRKLAKEIRSIIKRIEALKDKVHRVASSGLYGGFLDDVEKLRLKVALEVNDLMKLEENVQDNNYKLMQRFKKTISILEDTFDALPSLKKDSELDEIYQIVKKKKKMILELLEKEKNEAYDIIREKHDIFGFSTMQDLNSLAKKIRKRSKEVKRVIKRTEGEEREIIDVIKLLERTRKEEVSKEELNTNEVSKRKRSLGLQKKLLDEINIFLEHELFEASKLYLMSNDAAILLLKAYDELGSLDVVLERAYEQGSNEEWCRDNVSRINEILKNIKHHEKKWQERTA